MGPQIRGPRTKIGRIRLPQLCIFYPATDGNGFLRSGYREDGEEIALEFDNQARMNARYTMRSPLYGALATHEITQQLIWRKPLLSGRMSAFGRHLALSMHIRTRKTTEYRWKLSCAALVIHDPELER